MLEVAAILTLVPLIHVHGGVNPSDWPVFSCIGVLPLLLSICRTFQQNIINQATSHVMGGLAPKTKVLRDDRWSKQDATILVPGDIISIKPGDIVSVNALLLEGDPLIIDQSALTGELLPVTKNPGDKVFSGSTCKQGELKAVVIATGRCTFFANAAHPVETTYKLERFQHVREAIYLFCIFSFIVGMFFELTVMCSIQHRHFMIVFGNILVLLISGLPTAIKTVLSMTMAIDSQRLSQQGAITKRITAIEDLAAMDVLCSDKTGMLTLNKLSVDSNLIKVFA